MLNFYLRECELLFGSEGRKHQTSEATSTFRHAVPNFALDFSPISSYWQYLSQCITFVVTSLCVIVQCLLELMSWRIKEINV